MNWYDPQDPIGSSIKALLGFLIIAAVAVTILMMLLIFVFRSIGNANDAAICMDCPGDRIVRDE